MQYSRWGLTRAEFDMKKTNEIPKQQFFSIRGHQKIHLKMKLF